MKRVACVLCLGVFLFVGSVSVFADPYVVPDGKRVNSIQISNPPIVIVEETAGE